MLVHKSTPLGVALLSHLVAAANPIKVKSTQWISNYQIDQSSPYILRDGGLAGQIGGLNILTYSDTLLCPNQSEFIAPTENGCPFVASNTIVKLSFSAGEVYDYTTRQPREFCSTGGTGVSDGNRLHIGNVVATGATTGAVWYEQLNNKGDNGCDEIDGCVVAIGVAKVTGTDPFNQQPVCAPQATFWDATKEPVWGVSSAVMGPDKYIYLWGQLDGAGGSSYNDVYVARVANGSQLNYNAYQYWNGTAYSSNRLVNPNYNGWSPSAVLTDIAKFGSVHYNQYYKSYVLLAVNATSENQILAWTATRPEGPWSAPVSVYQNDTIGSALYAPIYSPGALTMYDTSGKTLTINWSLFGRNSVNGVVKVNFA